MENLKITVSLLDEGSAALFEQSEYVYGYDEGLNHQKDAQIHLRNILYKLEETKKMQKHVMSEEFITEVEKALSVIKERYGLQKYL